MNLDPNLFFKLCKSFLFIIFFSRCSNGIEIEKQNVASVVIPPSVEIEEPYYSKNAESYPRRKSFIMADKVFSSLYANVFSGRWVAMVSVPPVYPRQDDLFFVDRTTGEIVRTFEKQTIYQRAAGFFRE